MAGRRGSGSGQARNPGGRGIVYYAGLVGSNGCRVLPGAGRLLLAAVVLSLGLAFNGPAQVEAATSVQSLQSQLDAARQQVAQSSQSLAQARTQLQQTTDQLAQAKAQAAALQATNPQQIDQLKQQLAGAQSELVSILKDNSDRQNQLISDIGANQQLIDQTNDKIAGTNQQIADTNARLSDLATQIEQIRQQQAATQQETSAFLRETYKAQRRSLLEFLLEATSFGDFLAKVSYLQTMDAQENQLLSLLHDEGVALANSQAEQQQQLASLQELQSEQQTQKETLQLQGQHQEQLLEQARVEAQQAQARISAQEADVQALIDKKQGQMDQNEQLLSSLQAAESQLGSTISSQSDILAKAQQQQQAIASLIVQAPPPVIVRAAAGGAPIYAGSGNPFPYGQCTWWAAHVRPDIGARVWGNALNWAAAARSSGLAVGTAPRVGAIAVFQPGAQGADGDGHVAHVIGVGGNGQFTVDEMHFPWLGVVSQRDVSTGPGVSFIY